MEKITETTLDRLPFLSPPKYSYQLLLCVSAVGGGQRSRICSPGLFSGFSSAISDLRKNKSSGEKAEPPGIHQTTAATCIRNKSNCPGRQRAAPHPSASQAHLQAPLAPAPAGTQPIQAASPHTSSPTERPSPR